MLVSAGAVLPVFGGEGEESNRMPMRYGEHALAARGEMACAEGGAGYEAMIISGRRSSHFFHI
jgi:hypothetical protein